MGKKRLEENDALFTFIDTYMTDNLYDFEPNMENGDFMLVPKRVTHQGIGICRSSLLSNGLEVGLFWYPDEFTGAHLPIDQVYQGAFSVPPTLFPELVKMVKRVYIDDPMESELYCTFPFYIDRIVTLRGNFLDSMGRTARTIRNELAGANPAVERHSERLIQFMRDLMKMAE